ncbi:MAG: nucleotide-binding protein [Burkholderiales bacterium]|nr:nucleotide-binding protein [Burkholderiales bacterium]
MSRALGGIDLTSHEELFALAENLKKVAEDVEGDQIGKPLSALEDSARTIGRSFSGSWQGYHSRVYYEGFSPPPPGAHFSQEWGLMDTFASSLGSSGDWRECDPEAVSARIHELSGVPNLEKAQAAANAASKAFRAAQPEIISILLTELDGYADGFLEKLKKEVEELSPLSIGDVAQRLSPKGQIMTRDTVTLGQGTQVPPHVRVLAEVIAIRHSFQICLDAAEIATKAGSHIERKARRQKRAERIGTNVFIGHGQSPIWRDLKDFVQDRLKLPWDEFNRFPVAGVANTARLSEMLDGAAIAFLVMTAEDERADGSVQARMNVIHEAGLFQGRLGFMRAIVLLEEGCEQFSNIDGLGQIRFPSGNISSAFEEIRRVLEREGLIKPA